MLYKLLLGMGVLCNVAAQLFLKSSVRGHVIFTGKADVAARVLAIAGKPFFWLAVVSYGAGFLFYTLALSRLELSKAYPVSSVAAIVLIVAISLLFLKETLDVSKAAGLILCIAGIFLVLR